jgi:steroid 5-alpha reductase family enzyme
MSAAHLVLWVWAMSVLVMLGGWQWQRRHHNAGVVDVLWAGLLSASALLVAVLSPGAIVPRMILACLGGAWGLRLALHLAGRVAREPEDGRYRYLREHWHGSQLAFLLFFQLQALLVALFSVPFIAVGQNQQVRMAWLAAAVLIWLVSVLGESVADRQLARFRADPAHRGRTCRVGLWRYSRHPNYFFEWLHWFSYVALAVGSPLLWLAFGGPLVMFAFLRWLSGIPFTEAQALRTRGDDYRDYQRRTPMLFPWFPKESR